MLNIIKNRKICPCLITALAENKQEQKNLSWLNFGICLKAVHFDSMSSLIQLLKWQLYLEWKQHYDILQAFPIHLL